MDIWLQFILVISKNSKIKYRPKVMMGNMNNGLLSHYQGQVWSSLTGVVETAADLHGSQLTVEAYSPRRICSDLTGIFVPAFTAAICNTEQSVSLGGRTVKGRRGQREVERWSQWSRGLLTTREEKWSGASEERRKTEKEWNIGMRGQRQNRAKQRR